MTVPANKMKTAPAMGSEGLPLLPIDGLNVFFEGPVEHEEEI